MQTFFRVLSNAWQIGNIKKNGFWFKVKADVKFKSEEYR